ncbi:MAG: ATP-binding protein [Bacteroidia bacterium]
MNYLSRIAEQEILDLCAYFPAVAIVGPRQVGKTSLALHLADHLDRPALYIDLELPQDLALLQEPTLFLEQHRDKTLIIDEVQRVPHLFPVLRGLIDRHRQPGRFILLGSASPDLIRDASESLAGRIAYYELKPLTLAETGPGTDQRQHWLRGGFPEAFLAPDQRRSMQWRQNFIQTYLERDLPMLGLRADPMLIRRLWTMLAHLHGQMLNISQLAASLGISATSVRRYLDFLEAAYLIRRLMPYHANIGKRLVKSPKVYIRDSGILHGLLDLPAYDALLRHPVLGTSWEGYVLQEVMATLPAGSDVFFYRTADGAEADIVITRGGMPETLIEVKHSSAPSPSKGFHIASADLKTRRHFIVYPLERSYPVSGGGVVTGVQGLRAALEQE